MASIDSVIGEVAGKLRSAAQVDRAVEAAQVKVIGLEPLKAAAGDSWPQIRNSITAKAHAFLQNHLAPADIVIPCGDGFLVVFGSQDPAFCTRKCETLRERFEEFFLGDSTLDSLQTEIRRTALTAETFAKLQTGNDIVAPAAKVEVPTKLALPLFEAVFTPLWSVRDQLLLASICAPAHQAADGWRTGYGEESNSPISSGEAFAPFIEADLALLAARMKRVAVQRDGGKGSAVGISVHWSTLRDRIGSSRFFAALSDCKPELFRSCFLRITDIPNGTAQCRLVDVLAPFRSWPIKLWLSFHFSTDPSYIFRDITPWAVGISLPRRTFDLKPAAIVSLQRKIEKWQAAALRHNCRCIIEGVDNPQLVQAARSCGVDFLTSEHHWSPELPHAEPHLGALG